MNNQTSITRKLLTALGILCLFPLAAFAQPQLVDEVVATVGNKIVLRSEIESEYYQASKQFEDITPAFRCQILDQLIQNKLILYKAEIDSLPITEERIDAEIDRKIRYYVEQIGSEQKLEEYLGKSILEYKTYIRPKIREQMLIQDMQSKILKDVKITPTDVRKYYESIPKDSLPLIGSEVEVAQLVITSKVSPEAKEYAYNKIKELRERIMKGEDFGKLARLYSEDPVSAAQDGELGEFGRNQMVPAFEAAAFKLKPDSISKIIETSFGYHILKLIERKGERINVRHILIRPKTTKNDLAKARKLMDSLLFVIHADSVKFEEVAKKYSDDAQTKPNGGFFLDPSSGSTRIMMSSLEGPVVMALEKMNPGEITSPEFFQLPDGTEGYRVLYLKTETKPHIANLQEDWQKIQSVAQQKAQQEALDSWCNKYRKEIYIRIDPKYSDCKELNRWTTQKTN